MLSMLVDILRGVGADTGHHLLCGVSIGPAVAGLGPGHVSAVSTGQPSHGQRGHCWTSGRCIQVG